MSKSKLLNRALTAAAPAMLVSTPSLETAMMSKRAFPPPLATATVPALKRTGMSLIRAMPAVTWTEGPGVPRAETSPPLMMPVRRFPSAW